MGKPSRFWNLIARRYARMPVGDEASYREKLERTRAYLQPDWEVLEIGCGTGSTALEHAPYVRRLLAIDSSHRMIEICREKAAASGAGSAQFELAEVDDLDVADDTFDAVLAMSILHLLEDPEAVIARVFAMLRPGGMFFSSTACIADLKSAVARWLLPAGAAIGLLPRITRFSREELRRYMEAAGFEIEQEWQPDDDPAKAVFIAARKPGAAPG